MMTKNDLILQKLYINAIKKYKPFIICIFVYKFIMIYKKSEPKVEFEKFKEEDYILCKHEGFATMAIHEGCEPEPVHGSVNVPIHMTSTYAQKDIAQPYGKFDYTRGGNPTR